MSVNKKVVILGGGTFNHVRAHLSLAAPAFGETAKQLFTLSKEIFPQMDVELHLTKMADSTSSIVTNNDVSNVVDYLVQDNTVKVVFFNVALCDFDGQVGDIESSKYAERLETRNGSTAMVLTPSEKLIKKIRATRKDIFLVGFKTTCDADEETQYAKGLNLLKSVSANLVLVNDIGTRNNMIITPEEGVYSNGANRKEILNELVQMAFHRSHLSFTRSTVVDGKPVSWNDDRVYSSLRTVVDYCVSQGAYRKFNGVTTGHFACKIAPEEFLTSIRKTNFNEMEKHGLVHVKTDGDDRVISYGAKPSVGGQSQRIIFNTFNDTDCIVHFHCPLKENPRDAITIRSQLEYECGSHECGQNTATGLSKHGNVYAVMLDKHGPNIVFHHNVDPQEVIDFINANFDLDKSTSGFERVYLGVNYERSSITRTCE